MTSPAFRAKLWKTFLFLGLGIIKLQLAQLSGTQTFIIQDLQKLGDRISKPNSRTRDQHDAHYERNVPRTHGVDHQGSDPRPAENRFDDDRPRKQPTQCKPENSQKRIYRGPQNMSRDYRPFATAL